MNAHLIKPFHIDRSYIFVLLGIGLVVILFVISFISFTNSSSEAKLNGWQLIEDYFDSSIFKSVVLTIVVPLVAVIWRIYQDKLKVREQDLKERRKVREQDLKEKRIASIEKTFEEWGKINTLVSEVRFCKGKEDPKLDDIQLRLAQHSISFGELIYIWSSRFPILPDMAISLLVEYTTTLYWSAWAVAYSIRNNHYVPGLDENGKYRELQESLGIFQRGVVRTAFLKLVYILKDSARLLEYIEEHFSYDEQLQYYTIDTIKTSIESNIDQIFDSKKEIYRLIMEYRRSEEPWSQRNQILTNWLRKYENEVKILTNNGISLIQRKLDVTQEQASQLITNLIKNLCELKMRELFYQFDRFWRAEIGPPLQNATTSHDNYCIVAERRLREHYQKVKGKMDDELSDQKKNENRYSNKIPIDLSSKEYLNFATWFYMIQATDYMTIVAVDTVEFIKIIGRMIRLEHLFSTDSITPV